MRATAETARTIGEALWDSCAYLRREEFNMLVNDLIDNMLVSTKDEVFRLTNEARLLSARVRQFDDTTKAVGAMADTIAQRIAREVGKEVRKIRKYGR